MTAGTCQAGFCRQCYADAITRLCAGLPPVLAAAIRRAAREHLGTHGLGDTARHPHH